MITKEDVALLCDYFNELTSVPEELTTLVEKLNLMKTIQEANDDLMELMKDGE
ncbi:MAG: hypothetical protein IKE91_06230 [Clostridia bacterium]|nr:hypothetical protein [Clostridia bacterium]